MSDKKRKGHLNRIQGKDYSGSGYYFVTFKTSGSYIPLSEIQGSKTILNGRGELVQRAWENLPGQFENAFLDELIIMPDHVHAIVRLLGFSDKLSRPIEGFAPLMSDPRPVLGKIIRAWKAASTRAIRQSGWPQIQWQSRYDDRVIRDENQLERVRQYILDNPKAWENKKLFRTQ